MSTQQSPSYTPSPLASERGNRIAEIARYFVGCSLSVRRDELAELVACEADEPSIVTVRTNCGMFARGVMHRAGVVHELLEHRYRVGMAVADVLEIARRYSALFEWQGQALKRGAILHYATPRRNDDHIECCLLEPASDELGWVKLHCGGGRANNAITEATSDVRVSPLNGHPRPLLHFVDPDLLLEPI